MQYLFHRLFTIWGRINVRLLSSLRRQDLTKKENMLFFVFVVMKQLNPTCKTVSINVSADLHWPNIFTTNFCELHWQKFSKLACNLVLYICDHRLGYLDVAIAKNLRNSQIICHTFATIFAKTDYERRSRKYFVSVSWGAPESPLQWMMLHTTMSVICLIVYF